MGQKEKTEKKKRKDQKYVITMASYALQRHLGWRTQSHLGQLMARHPYSPHPTIGVGTLWGEVWANLAGSNTSDMSFF